MPSSQGLGSPGPERCREAEGTVLRAACLTILLVCPPPHTQALLHMLLLYGLVVSTALIWHPINKLAAVLLLPYLAWLTVTASIAYRLWRDSLCPNHHQPLPMGEKRD